MPVRSPEQDRMLAESDNATKRKSPVRNLLLQNRQLAYSRAIYANHVSQLQLDIRHLRRENQRLREHLLSLTRQQAAASAAAHLDRDGQQLVQDNHQKTAKRTRTGTCATHQNDKEQREESGTSIGKEVHDSFIDPAHESGHKRQERQASLPSSLSQPQQEEATVPALAAPPFAAMLASQKRHIKQRWKIKLAPVIEEAKRTARQKDKGEQQSTDQTNESQPIPVHEPRKLRAKPSTGYRLPSLRCKLRKGDPYTFD